MLQALRDAEAHEILIDSTPWADVHRAWTLSRGSVRYADAIYVAAAERLDTALHCAVVTVTPVPSEDLGPTSGK